ncbi:GspE/PulE family protein [Albibacterium sp.]|uniref:GspE/PulE family protein n=1 Tax=Albibacterium sp. TaxID=2952885 RepID=UPI002BBBA1BE|nr:GspE/PulE family protein [Albibacterium sp.]HUH17858.1 GspE/PulE family protein [Albibacterium sp.]
MNSKNNTIIAANLQILNDDQAWHYRAIAHRGEYGIEIHTDNQDSLIKEELEFMVGEAVKVILTDREELTKQLQKYHPRINIKKGDNPRIYTGNSENFLNDLILEANRLKSSDIHIESYEQSCRIRIRIDGQMAERYQLKKNEYPAIINKIKIFSGLDIAEKRLPQDGRINYSDNHSRFDIRVSILPTLHGEKIVMRLLNNDATNIDINNVGFNEDDLKHYLESVNRPNGMVLISGPTGSGKTTTLYSTLKVLNKESRNILTIEDPIEYTLEGINQVQLKESIGLTFPVALRTFLRQDPDIIMVGEIRDVDTAAMAIRASLTGHLVLSTIHTNSAWGTVSRLIDMGIPAFLLANTLNATIAQRLLRVLCQKCKEKEAFNPELYPPKFKPYFTVNEHYIKKGCDSCFHTGYSGRKAVYEIIPIDTELGMKIKDNCFDISPELKKRKIKTLAENAFSLFASGETTLKEIYPLLFNY